jgi:hypothetical protein
MIELTEQQMEALDEPTAIPPCVVNPRTKEMFVLVRSACGRQVPLKKGEQA